MIDGAGKDHTKGKTTQVLEPSRPERFTNSTPGKSIRWMMDGEMPSRRHRPNHASIERTLNKKKVKIMCDFFMFGKIFLSPFTLFYLFIIIILLCLPQTRSTLICLTILVTLRHITQF